MDEWIEKVWCMYTAIIKKEIPFVQKWMELVISMLGEISQSHKDKYHMLSPICEC
jgi:hypothetical protein